MCGAYSSPRRSSARRAAAPAKRLAGLDVEPVVEADVDARHTCLQREVG